MSNQSDPEATVKFNVGGKIFEVARSLIDQHEGTMLARLVSDTWQEDPTKPVFIDRNGDTFSHVLDYLRYGSIALPITVTKETFLRDMDFYGIVPEEGSVKTCSEAWAVEVASRHEKIKSLDAKRAGLQLENDLDYLAGFCASKHLRCSLFHQTLTIKYPYECAEDSDEYELFQAARASHDTFENRGVLQKSLSKFGLRLTGFKYYPSSRKYPRGERVEIGLGPL